jgi:hypothetical protein
VLEPGLRGGHGSPIVSHDAGLSSFDLG